MGSPTISVYCLIAWRSCLSTQQSSMVCCMSLRTASTGSRSGQSLSPQTILYCMRMQPFFDEYRTTVIRVVTSMFQSKELPRERTCLASLLGIHDPTLGDSKLG